MRLWPSQDDNIPGDARPGAVSPLPQNGEEAEAQDKLPPPPPAKVQRWAGQPRPRRAWGYHPGPEKDEDEQRQEENKRPPLVRRLWLEKEFAHLTYRICARDQLQIEAVNAGARDVLPPLHPTRSSDRS